MFFSMTVGVLYRVLSMYIHQYLHEPPPAPSVRTSVYSFFCRLRVCLTTPLPPPSPIHRYVPTRYCRGLHTLYMYANPQSDQTTDATCRIHPIRPFALNFNYITPHHLHDVCMYVRSFGCMQTYRYIHTHTYFFYEIVGCPFSAPPSHAA